MAFKAFVEFNRAMVEPLPAYIPVITELKGGWNLSVGVMTSVIRKMHGVRP